MTFDRKINELRERIEKVLIPLIDHDYVLWGLPYHSNIGDMLIWEGEESLLKKTGYRCVGRASQFTCDFPVLSPDTIIVLQGGGDFGDLWRWVQEFRLEVIRRYPANKIIVLPQSVYYQDTDLMLQDAEKMALHPRLVLCVRDKVSEKILKNYFRNEILLLPDMAFCIAADYFSNKQVQKTDIILFLKRGDKELSPCFLPLKNLSGKVDIRDWPSMEKNTFILKIFGGLSICRQLTGKYNCLHFLESLFGRWENLYAAYILRPHLIKQGVRFVSKYKQVYTTRLHVLILAVILGKEVSFLDNSYGKNSSFYHAWLSDLPKVKKVETNV